MKSCSLILSQDPGLKWSGTLDRSHTLFIYSSHAFSVSPLSDTLQKLLYLSFWKNPKKISLSRIQPHHGSCSWDHQEWLQASIHSWLPSSRTGQTSSVQISIYCTSNFDYYTPNAFNFCHLNSTDQYVLLRPDLAACIGSHLKWKDNIFSPWPTIGLAVIHQHLSQWQSLCASWKKFTWYILLSLLYINWHTTFLYCQRKKKLCASALLPGKKTPINLPLGFARQGLTCSVTAANHGVGLNLLHILWLILKIMDLPLRTQLGVQIHLLLT